MTTPVATLTLEVPFDMAAFDFGDIFNGTITSMTSTEVDYTGVSGQHYEFQGHDFSAVFQNAPLDGTITSFTMDGILTLSAWTNPDDGVGASISSVKSLGWSSSMLVLANEFGSSGNDTLVMGTSATGYGLAGDDVLDAETTVNTLDGGTGNDTLNGLHIVSEDDDTTALYSDAVGSGVRINLSLTTAQNVGGGLGHDTLNFIENLIGSKFSDTLIGNSGDNALNGLRGVDALAGGAGNDTLYTQSADSTLNGGSGTDTVIFTASTGLNIDLNHYTSIETVIATNADDTILGTARGETFNGKAGDDEIHGGGGRDTLIGATGNDLLDGGTASDVVNYVTSTDGITLDLTDSGPQFVSASSGTDTLVSIESVLGSRAADTITGNNAANYLYGDLGNDVLNGGYGNDELDGSAGVDVLTGGAGHDTFDFVSPIQAIVSYIGAPDTITDFQSGIDRIHLAEDGVAFVPNTVLFMSGELDAASFATQVRQMVGASMPAHEVVLITASSGDLSGESFLVANAMPASQLTTFAVVVHFGSDSTLGSFGVNDFI